MRRLLILAATVLLALAVLPAAQAADHTDVRLTVARAPVAADGLAAGAPTDFVVTFIDRDPDVPGLALKAGAEVIVQLDDAFTPGPGTNVGVLLQGWPQSPPAPPPAFPWTTSFDGTTVTIELTQDWNPGDVGPGAKQVHLALLGWTNPKAGVYPLTLSIQPDPASDATITGHTSVRIDRAIRPAVSAVSLFSGGGPPPPFNNPLYQDIEVGDSSLPVGLYLWNAGGEPFADIEVRKMGARWYRLFDGHRTVGHIRVQSPRGARDHEVTVVQDYMVTNAFLTGVPVGLLQIQFTPDANNPGDYEVHVKMAGGNRETIRVSVAD